MVPGTSRVVVARMAVGPRWPSSLNRARTSAARSVSEDQKANALGTGGGVQHDASRRGLDHPLRRHPGAAQPAEWVVDARLSLSIHRRDQQVRAADRLEHETQGSPACKASSEPTSNTACPRGPPDAVPGYLSRRRAQQEQWPRRRRHRCGWSRGERAATAPPRRLARASSRRHAVASRGPAPWTGAPAGGASNRGGSRRGGRRDPDGVPGRRRSLRGAAPAPPGSWHRARDRPAPADEGSAGTGAGRSQAALAHVFARAAGERRQTGGDWCVPRRPGWPPPRRAGSRRRGAARPPHAAWPGQLRSTGAPGRGRRWGVRDRGRARRLARATCRPGPPAACGCAARSGSSSWPPGSIPEHRLARSGAGPAGGANAERLVGGVFGFGGVFEHAAAAVMYDRPIRAVELAEAVVRHVRPAGPGDCLLERKHPGLAGGAEYLRPRVSVTHQATSGSPNG